MVVGPQRGGEVAALPGFDEPPPLPAFPSRAHVHFARHATADTALVLWMGDEA